jgi:hypothetical protein
MKQKSWTPMSSSSPIEVKFIPRKEDRAMWVDLLLLTLNQKHNNKQCFNFHTHISTLIVLFPFLSCEECLLVL